MSALTPARQLEIIRSRLDTYEKIWACMRAIQNDLAIMEPARLRSLRMIKELTPMSKDPKSMKHLGRGELRKGIEHVAKLQAALKSNGRTLRLIQQTLRVTKHKLVAELKAPERLATNLDNRDIDRRLTATLSKLRMVHDLTEKAAVHGPAIADDLEELKKLMRVRS